jgi:hypothetical protein
LPFAKAVTETVGRYYEKDFERRVSVLIDSKAGVPFFQAIRLQFCEDRFGVINLKETSFLGWVASILGQANLNAIPGEDSGLPR